MFGKKGSKILKLPPVRNCFTLAMTNKLVVIINNLRVPKIKKILLYEMKFLVPNYSCLQNPWLGGYRPKIPVLSVLCPQLNLLNPPPPEQNSWVRHWMFLVENSQTCIARPLAQIQGRRSGPVKSVWRLIERRDSCVSLLVKLSSRRLLEGRTHSCENYIHMCVSELHYGGISAWAPCSANCRFYTSNLN